MTTFAPVVSDKRVTPIITLLLVFLCGGASGAMVMSIAGHPFFEQSHNSPKSSSAALSMSVSEWKEKLDLSEKQTRDLTSILDDFSSLYDNLLGDGKTRIMRILDDRQKRKYEQMMQDHRKP